jgi:sec-independent protein translocase protein TatB
MFLEGKTLELLIAAVVVLVVVGPKDMPILLRRFGQFMAKLRGMAAEFRASFDEMARQSELDELRKEVEALRRGQLADIAAHAGGAEANQAAADIHKELSEVGVQLHPPMSYQYAEAPSEPAPEPPPLTISAAEPAPAPKVRKPRTEAAAKPVAKPKAPAPAKTSSAKPAAVKAKTAAKPRARAAKSAGSKS